MNVKKHSRSLIRFVLAAIMILVGINMLDNLVAGIFSLVVAAYALTSGILWLRVERRPDSDKSMSKK
ncbi:hypothetical protein [Saccharibacillus sp. JS10]|uniref:hypothetical protein n=1 Tax=Saccharibacillus sp. JS10 TaxID=2950552 RepID=UPI00210F209F|nr:hypothetical protein [Saccharibacillus sp. JS10]MCQ4087864.1 hypothetical protein [Saccharibacillus sp. JS10]